MFGGQDNATAGTNGTGAPADTPMSGVADAGMATPSMPSDPMSATAGASLPEPAAVTTTPPPDLPTAPTDPSTSSPLGTPSATPSSDGNTDHHAPTMTPMPEGADEDDLLNLKQSALQQLSPLIDHLDQTPEDRFRTTMMMIQASDNSSLIQRAYDAAASITDEKAKAQALLDIVNEINYFTQHHDDKDRDRD